MLKFKISVYNNFVISKESSTFAPANKKYRGVEQLVARQAHNLEVARSSPASATIKPRNALNKGFSAFRV